MSRDEFEFEFSKIYFGDILSYKGISAIAKTWKVRCYYTTFSSRQKTNSPILKNNSSVGLVLSKTFCNFVKCSVKII